MPLKRLIYFSLLLFLFLLPWQTRVVYAPAFLNGQFWEYGSGSWYATELLLWVVIILSALDRFRQKSFWEQIAGREHFQRYRLRLLFLLGVLAYALWQVVRSANPAISYQWLFRLLGGLCLFVVLAEWKGRSRHLLTAFWAGGVVQGILAVWQFFSQAVAHVPGFGIAPQTAARLGSFVIETGAERWLRAYGSFGSPNILGGYLALVFIIGLLLYLKSAPRYRIFLIAGQMTVLAGLVLSFSRAAWVAAAAGIFTIVILIPTLHRGKNPLNNEVRKNIIKQLVFSFLTILTLFFILRPLFTARFIASARLEARSLTERLEQYRDARSLFRERWLAGVGPGAYTAALFGMHPKRPPWDLQPVHNLYFLLLVELGVIGSALFFWWCFLIARRIFESGRRWLPVLLTLLVLGLFDHWLVSLYAGQMVWWAIFGLGLAQSNIDGNASG